MKKTPFKVKIKYSKVEPYIYKLVGGNRTNRETVITYFYDTNRKTQENEKE